MPTTSYHVGCFRKGRSWRMSMSVYRYRHVVVGQGRRGGWKLKRHPMSLVGVAGLNRSDVNHDGDVPEVWHITKALLRAILSYSGVRKVLHESVEP